MELMTRTLSRADIATLILLEVMFIRIAAQKENCMLGDRWKTAQFAGVR
jgi:hypothetical protein